MVNLLRKYQQTLMIVITVVVIIAFVVLYNQTSFEKMGSGKVATVYGQSLTRTDVDRVQRELSMAVDLGLQPYVQLLGGMEQNGFENFIFNRLVAKHEAERLQIGVTQENVLEAIKSLPRFQTNGQFDPKLLAEFYQKGLAPRGFSERQLEELIRAALTTQKLEGLIGSTTVSSESEFRSAYAQQYEKLVLNIVRFNASDFAKDVPVSDDDVKQAFEQRKEALKTDEQRSVKFVTFKMDEGAESKLTGDELTDKLQKLADKAQEFAQEMLQKDADFDKVAAKFGLEVTTTGTFTQRDPDTALPEASATAAAFKLTSEDPNSDPIQVENRFIVLHLVAVEAPRPLSFEEAKDGLAAQLKVERGSEKLFNAGAGIRGQILQAMQGGKSFEEAAAAIGLKVEKPEPFSLAEPPTSAKMLTRDILSRAIELAPGATSDFTPSEEGGFIVHLATRQPFDEAKYKEDHDKMFANFNGARAMLAFREWLRTARDQAKIQYVTVSR